MQGVYGEAVCFPYTEYILRQNKSHFFQSADRRGKMTIADLTGRVEAKTTISILNANRPCAEHRTSNARPYGSVFFAALSFRHGNLRKPSQDIIGSSQ